MDVPQDAGVVHHDDERPHLLPLDTLLLQSVSLQLQVVVRQLFDHEASSTWKQTGSNASTSQQHFSLCIFLNSHFAPRPEDGVTGDNKLCKTKSKSWILIFQRTFYEFRSELFQWLHVRAVQTWIYSTNIYFMRPRWHWGSTQRTRVHETHWTLCCHWLMAILTPDWLIHKSDYCSATEKLTFHLLTAKRHWL